VAQSPSHKFGQIIGDLVEAMIHAPLKRVAREHGLYLDYKHQRRARDDKWKVAWTDHRGNVHDLDYVFEKGGSETTIGSPQAFIESAWRRYTKHSRNKAQEIQGAIGPLAETYSEHYPFLGVVLAGVFTDGSLQQLRSHGFSILYLPYETICRAFAAVGIDAAFDEQTPDRELQAKVDAWVSLPDKDKNKVVSALKRSRKAEIHAFLSDLEMALKRTIERIYIVALHGPGMEVASIDAAVAFVEGYSEDKPARGFVRYEINVQYSNGDTITGSFSDKRTAIEFLHGLH